jgi:hypothetical protein
MQSVCTLISQIVVDIPDIFCLAQIKVDFPWWDELHSFWMELPNYNLIGVMNSTALTANKCLESFKSLLYGTVDADLEEWVKGWASNMGDVDPKGDLDMVHEA